MSIADIIRAWKDEEYRRSLSPEELTLLPMHPAGQVELSDLELETIHGGGTVLGCVLSILKGGTCWDDSFGCCPSYNC